jgi:tetratricopeptide (TPR) repeat protein
MMGDVGGARAEPEQLLKVWSPSLQSSTIYLVHDRHFRAGIALARTLWLQGYPAQAVERARETVKLAERMDHPASLTVLLTWVASIFLWTGDLQSAEEHINSSVAIAESYSLGPLAAVGRARKAQLAIRRGDALDGVASMRSSLEEIHAVRYELITTEFNISLLEGLAALGQVAEATRLLDDAIRQVETNGDTCYMPELLRLKAGLLQSIVQPRLDGAETCLMQSLELSRRQGARGWELRSAIDLATLWAHQEQHDRGRILLRPVFEQFTEGFETDDLQAAERLLKTLS